MSIYGTTAVLLILLAVVVVAVFAAALVADRRITARRIAVLNYRAAVRRRNYR